jgi:hypothetical protein
MQTLQVKRQGILLPAKFEKRTMPAEWQRPALRKRKPEIKTFSAFSTIQNSTRAVAVAAGWWILGLFGSKDMSRISDTTPISTLREKHVDRL